MNYGQFLNMVPEFYLVLILIAVFAVDFIMHKSEKKHDVLSAVTIALMAVLPFRIALLSDPSEAFGGLYVASEAVNVMKVILAFGTLIVLIMAQPWLKTARRLEGEFYMLVISTLLGMFVMMSSGNFLLFFLGLEMASVPMACMVAFDKWKQNSAEGAAKYILTATFSSGVMLYGISFIYAAAGTLYFGDVAATITASPLAIMGMVFFFSGLGFKISLVPFHFWTADTYQGAPTPVTGYLSVISKGAAALTLCIIGVPAAGGLLGVSALYRHRALHHGGQPLRHPSERAQAIHGLQLHLSGRLYHAGSGGQRSDGRHGIDLLCACVYRGQHGCLHRHQRGGAQQRRSHRYGSLQRFLPDQSQALVPHDAGAVLAGGYSAVRRYVLEVLRVHGCSRAG